MKRTEDQNGLMCFKQTVYRNSKRFFSTNGNNQNNDTAVNSCYHNQNCLEIEEHIVFVLPTIYINFECKNK